MKAVRSGNWFNKLENLVLRTDGKSKYAEKCFFFQQVEIRTLIDEHPLLKVICVFVYIGINILFLA